jgi:hypothetical protein
MVLEVLNMKTGQSRKHKNKDTHCIFKVCLKIKISRRMNKKYVSVEMDYS